MQSVQNKLSFSVLHVATAHSWRGGEQQVAYLVEELKKHHLRQYVLCCSDSAMEEYCIKKSIPFFAFNKRSSFDLTFAKKIKDLCESNSIDLVHTHDTHAHTFAVVAAMFGNKARIMVSRRIDNKVNQSPISKYKYNHSAIGKIMCVSDRIREITLEMVDDPLKVVTVHSGIDISKFEGKKNNGILHHHFNLSDSTRIVANISALAAHKDHTTFIHTASLVVEKFPETVFLIMGEGPEKEKIEKLIKEKSIEDKIILTGFRNDIPDLLPEIDLLLLTSETEGLGTTILDAFACNVPVVATAAGGIPELVIHEETGLLADVKDQVGLANHVMAVLENAALKSQLVAGAKKHLQHFTKEVTATKTLTEYLSVIGSAL